MPAKPNDSPNKEERVMNIRAKFDEKKNSFQLVGYAARFNELSSDLGMFREKIEQGAFSKALKKSDVRALFNHDPNYVLARNTNGTLRMKEDKKGLNVEIDIEQDNATFRDLVVRPVSRGDVNQMSFGFTVGEETWDWSDKNNPVRTINEIEELYDVSVVTYPAYPTTEVALRSLEKHRETRAGHTEKDFPIFTEEDKNQNPKEFFRRFNQ